MFGLETLLGEMGLSTEEAALAGYCLLLLATLVAKVGVEIKNKDLRWNDIPEFASVVLRYIVFLVGLEAMGLIFGVSQETKELFKAVQVAGFIGATIHCFKHLVASVRLLGMDLKQFNSQLDQIDPETKTMPEIVKEIKAIEKEESQ
jgi:hypothetical protein